MGMFDWYKPAQTQKCPVCGIALKDWQGKDGPNGLFVWREGEKYPVDQRVDDDVLSSSEELQQWTLPECFYIYSYDCPQHRPIFALCTTQKEIWSSTKPHPFDLSTHKN